MKFLLISSDIINQIETEIKKEKKNRFSPSKLVKIFFRPKIFFENIHFKVATYM